MKKKKPATKVERISHIMAWLMITLTLTGLLLPALIALGVIG